MGRPPIGVPRMLRMYFLQQWYSLADEALEDALYDSQALRDFVGIDLAREPVPDATTLLKFRRLLEEHDLTQGAVRGGQRAPGRARAADARGHDRGRHHHRRAELDQEQGQGSATPRCTRPRRATSGTSA